MYEFEFYPGFWMHLQRFWIFIAIRVVGIIIAIVLYRRARRSALLVIAALTVSLFFTLAWPLIVEFSYRLMERGTLREEFFFEIFLPGMSWIQRIGHPLCWLALVIAAFMGRTRGDDTATLSVTTGMSNAMPERGRTDDQAKGILSALPSERLSKGFYFGWVFGSMGFSCLLLIPVLALLVDGGRDEAAIALGFLCFLIVPLTLIVIFLMRLVFRMWAAIQGGGMARTTPGKAVGFLFIPLFNIYWVFQAYWGWSVDFNRTVMDAGLPKPRVSEGVALSMCILTVLSAIPYVGLLFALPNIVLVIVFLNSAINGVNAIADAKARLAGEGVANA